jgi:hypothetical protein
MQPRDDTTGLWRLIVADKTEEAGRIASHYQCLIENSGVDFKWPKK